jgi:hypothetical protein
MMRSTILTLALVLLGCHHEPQPVHSNPGELPPLPPASGTPIGYLLDSADTLKLRDDQLKQLKDIDASLAARDAGIDTQLRQLERPSEEEEQQQQGPGPHKRPHHNNAPGASTTQTGDSNKLHEMRNANDRDALKKAWALLDPEQQTSAKKILEERGVQIPGTQQKKPDFDPNDGTPLPGGEP